jgi:hypothetical protein
MINRERGFPPADRKWMGWPTDVRQRALAVIAKTRYEWASRGATDEPVVDRPRFAHPLFELALDAESSSAGWARGTERLQ